MVKKVLGELTIKEFDELIEGYIERGGPDAVSFTAFGEVLADLEVESVQEAIEVTSVVSQRSQTSPRSRPSRGYLRLCSRLRPDSRSHEGGRLKLLQ